MSVELKSFLQGKWVSGHGKSVFLYNPTTEEKIAEASTEGLDFHEALHFARKQGGKALRSLHFKERAHLLRKMVDAIHQKRDELIEVAIQNSGNTRKDGKFDIDGATAVLSAYAEIGDTLGEHYFLTEEEIYPLGRTPRFAGQHILTPLQGVAVHINAFNFPAWGFAEKAASALLAGVPIFVKPATSTALLTYRIAELLVPLMPTGTFSLICGPIGNLLEHLTAQDMVAFTGSSETGSKIKSHPNLIRNNIRVNVEADSLNATILGPDVEPETETFKLFLMEVAREMTSKAGQKCTAIRRIFVPESRLEAVQEQLIERLKEIVIGDPQLKEVQMGPLATADQLQSAKNGLKTLLKSAQIVYGNPETVVPKGVPANKGYFFPPVLLKANPETAKEVHDCEIFGPVSTLLPYPDTDLESLTRWVERGGGSLVSSVFSDDKKFLQQIVLQLAPFHGRILMGTEKIVELSTGHGTVMPQLVHGGPGRAGGGEELGGLRGMHFYLQRTAIQGYRPLLESFFGTKPSNNI